jgi:putative cell wall-binding protein
MQHRHPSAARRRTRAAVALVGAVTVLIGGFPAALAIATFDLTRLAGGDRYATGASVAMGSFRSANTVVVATGMNFPDALAGNYIAGQTGSPIVLTQKDVVPAATQAAIEALNPATVVILGGTDAIAAGGVPTGAEVRRIAGATRYATAVAAAEAGGTVASLGGVKTAIVASGENFPDALSAGPAAWAHGLPLLLTPRSSLDDGTRAFLADNSIGKVILMGGTAAIEDSVAASIRMINTATPLVVDRIAGADRTETARLFAEYGIAKLGFRSDGIDVARGDLYPDALAGGPHAGNDKHPILLTASPTVASNSVGTGVIKYATDHSNSLASGHVFGGTSAVSTATELEIEAAARGARSNATFSVGGDREESELGPAGSRTCTVPGLSDGVFDARLFPSENIVVATDGTVTFVDSNDDDIADEPGVGANIVQVNGVTVVPSAEQNDVAATGSPGTLSFTIQGAAPDDVTLVVWQDAASLTPQALDLRSPATASTSSAPSEKFGFGCRTAFMNEAPSGSIGSVVVTAVDKDNDSFATASATYFYDANDVFQMSSGGACGAVVAGAFESALSPGDSVSGTYSQDVSVASTFCLMDSAPVNPAGVTFTPFATQILVKITESPTPSTDGYNVYRVARPISGTCPDFQSAAGRPSYTAVGSVADPTPGTSTSATAEFTDTGLTDGTTYCYVVTAADDGDESSGTSEFAQAPGSIGGSSNPTIVDVRAEDNGVVGVVDGRDVHRFIFSEPMALTIDDQFEAYRIADSDAIPTIVDVWCQVGDGNDMDPASADCGLNAASVTIGGTTYAAGRVLTVHIGTAAGVISVQGGTTPGLSYPATITNVSAGWKSAAGSQLGLEAGDVSIDVQPFTGP